MSPKTRTEKTTFCELFLTGNNGAVKPIDDGTAWVDAKALYLGSKASWKIPWKQIEKVEFKTPHNLLIECSSGDTIHCVDAVDPDAGPFFGLAEKVWNKTQGKRQATKEPVALNRPAKQARRTYGKQHKSYSSRRPAVSVMAQPIYFSDDEPETESWKKIEEPTELPAPDQDVIDDIIDEPTNAEPVNLDDDEEEPTVNDKQTAGKCERSKKQRLQKFHIPRDEEVSDDEEDLFGNPAVTTPAAKRLVSPANDASDTNKDEHHAEENDNVAAADRLPPPKRNATLTSFFAPRVPLQMTKQVPRMSPKKPIIVSSPVTPIRAPLKRDSTEWLSKRHFKPMTPCSTNVDGSDVDSPRYSEKGSPEMARTALFSGTKKLTTSPQDVHDDELVETPPRTAINRQRFRLDTQRRKRLTLLTPHRDEAFSSADRALALYTTKETPGRGISMNPYAKPARASIELTPKSPWRGLQNLGNTCFVNSSLQMLYSVPSFVSALSNKGGDLAKSIVSVSDKLKDTSKYGAASPNIVKRAMDAVTDKFAGYEQRDAHEFLSDLVDRVHDELEEETKENDNGSVRPTDEFFRMNVNVCLTCDSCGYARNKEEMYRHLSVVIEDHERKGDDEGNVTPSTWSIQRAIERFFEPEKREIKCEKCNEGTTATQTMRIISCSRALLLHLKRFAIFAMPVVEPEGEEGGSATETPKDAKKPPAIEMTVRKNRKPVAIDATISLRPFIATSEKKENESSSQQTFYELRSVVHHIGGTAMSGHYTADALRTNEFASTGGQPDEWVSFDDSMTTSTNADQVLNSTKSQKSAYMLLYTLQQE